MSYDDVLREQVTYASAGTYGADALEKNHFRLEINTTFRKNRFVGPSTDPIYPEIIIWRPGVFNSNGMDMAFIVECIETNESVKLNLEKWKKITCLDVKFNLIIPKDCLHFVGGVLAENGINTRIKLQTYEYSLRELRYIFE